MARESILCFQTRLMNHTAVERHQIIPITCLMLVKVWATPCITTSFQALDELVPKTSAQIQLAIPTIPAVGSQREVLHRFLVSVSHKTETTCLTQYRCYEKTSRRAPADIVSSCRDEQRTWTIRDTSLTALGHLPVRSVHSSRAPVVVFCNINSPKVSSIHQRFVSRAR